MRDTWSTPLVDVDGWKYPREAPRALGKSLEPPDEPDGGPEEAPLGLPRWLLRGLREPAGVVKPSSAMEA